ncbi:hypothetical protein [Nocardioides sp. SYSU D00065]|uniref:hypothetical protein n=1 Tax=Nocardioides sp. SYSU D00065 TaxID=2817378 RepID=UPI001B33FD53|nr:hypothetical protein [Nocardioides sp. SYSU D00065]
MPPVADLQNLPAPLAFIGGVLGLLIWFARALRQLIKEWNDEARTELAKVTDRVSSLEKELAKVREDLVTQVRDSHAARLKGLRREQQLTDLLVKNGIDVPEEHP